MTRRVSAVAVAAVLLGMLAGCAVTAGEPGRPSQPGVSSSAAALGRALAAERARARLAPCPATPGRTVPGRTVPSRAVRPGGDTLPDLTLPCLAGGPDLRLAALTGVPTVLTAWASWCLPCRRELPYFQRLADATRGRLRVLGVASDEPSMDDPLTFAAAFGVRFASGYDPAGRLRAARGVAGLPFTLLVRADGTVATVHIGPFGSAELAAAVQRQFGVSAGG